MAATQWLTFCYGLAIHRGIFQTREPQGPMRRVQAAAAIAMTLPSAGLGCLQQGAVRHLQLHTQRAGGRFFGAVDMGL
ncbi:hypothetical protein D3C76_855370 [compost metagenome]